MHDIKFIRDNPTKFDDKMKNRKNILQTSLTTMINTTSRENS